MRRKVIGVTAIFVVFALFVIGIVTTNNEPIDFLEPEQIALTDLPEKKVVIAAMQVPAPTKICGEYGWVKKFDATDPRSNARLRIYIKGAPDHKIEVCSKASKIEKNDARFRITHWYNNGTTDPWEKVRGGYQTKVTTGNSVYVKHIRWRSWATLGKVTHAGVGSSSFSYAGL